MKIEVKQVSFSYPNQVIMEDFTLHVKDQEFVSLVGPSGCGKSTLFTLIGGVEIPQRGSIQLDGQIVNGKRGLVAYMPQQASLFPWRTVRDNILLAQELMGNRNPNKVTRLLEKANLIEVQNLYPYQLSGGMQQRVAFLRALATDQSLLLLDEPFGALDALTREEMQQWLRMILKDEKRTVLFITHSIEEALLLSDRIYVLSQKPMKVLKEIHVPFTQEERWKTPIDPLTLEYKEQIREWLGFGKGLR